MSRRLLVEYLEYLRDAGVREQWGRGSFPFEPKPDVYAAETGVAAVQPEPVTPEPAPQQSVKTPQPTQAAGRQSAPKTPEYDEYEQYSDASGEYSAQDWNSMPTTPVKPTDSEAAADWPDQPNERPSFMTLEELREYIGDCNRCKLHKGRTNIVFGAGDHNARLVFVGEGPGRDEDIQGLPFVGRSGQLLTDIIEKGMKLKRSEVYIANIVKCRPPDNRNPERDEIAACEGFLMSQLDIIKPDIICALGTFAAQTLLRTKEPIGRLRGAWHEYNGIKLMPTYHPAYLIRNPADKRLVWEDVQKIMAEFAKLKAGK